MNNKNSVSERFQNLSYKQPLKPASSSVATRLTCVNTHVPNLDA